MKPIPRHTRSIEIEFTNQSNKLLCFRATIPFNKVKHNISQWYKTTKEAVANSEQVPLWRIKGKHKIIESIYFNRILFEWPGGIALNMPDDTKDLDYKIILHYLEGLKMSCKK